MSKKIKTVDVTGVIAVTQEMGDKLATSYHETEDLKVAQTSLSAYKTAIGGAKAQLTYKKLTGSPKEIPFFE